MQPSQRQQAILDVWTTTNENILISAVAGSGKTSTLLMLLEKCDARTLFVAFNKSIQTEIQTKIDERGLGQGKAMTMHSLGLLAVRATGKRVVINNNKNWNLIKILQQGNRSIYREIQSLDVPRINFSLIDMNDASRNILSDDFETIENYLRTLDKTISEHHLLPVLWEKFVELRNITYEENTIEIDFADMIYVPIHKNLEIPVYASYLMIDEAQDLNIAQHALVDKLINQETLKKWIAVGDRNQAIYGFSGASSKSFDIFTTKSNNVKEMPLDICYRCSTNIIQAANSVYPIMQPAPNASQGHVSIETEPQNIKPNSMVICRNTAPIFDLYFTLLGLGKPCYINGADLMGSLVKFIKPYIRETIYSASREMSYKLEDLAKKMEKDEDRIRYFVFKENVKIFTEITKHVCKPSDSIDHLLTELRKLFENQENAIMLCTIHKSKGLEADVVYIINESTTIPSKFAKSTEQLKQEKNLKYVARTRAKKEMYFLNLLENNVESVENI